MDLILIVIWIAIAFGFLFGLIGSVYYAYIHNPQRLDVIAKSALAVIIYGFCTLGMRFLAGILLFIGAHADTPGSTLGSTELFVCGVLTVAYATVGWLTCSFVLGELLLPDGVLRHHTFSGREYE